MQIQYFKSAWGDIKNSPGWFGKLCLLALLNFIPVFGQIVTFAYLYGWAREIAWGTHEPMPAKIFSNEDGKFWRRGWFVLVLTFVFALVPQVVMQLGDVWQIMGTGGRAHGAVSAQNSFLAVMGSLLFFVGLVGAILLSVLAWIGSMRIAIYDRLSAGFQFGKIWKMLRYDTNGILKIFGMNLLVSLILGVILSFLIFMAMFVVAAVGVAGLVGAGYSVDSLQYMSDAQALHMMTQFFSSAGIVGVLAILLVAFATSLASLYVDTLVIRALGYWTLQFDVPRWGGQDEPLPFESAAPAQPVAPASVVPPVQEPYTAPMGDIPAEQQPSYGAPAGVAPLEQQPQGYGAPVEPDEVMPAVEYGEPVQVGAAFIMTPEQIDQAQAAIDQAQQGQTGSTPPTIASDPAEPLEATPDGSSNDDGRL